MLVNGKLILAYQRKGILLNGTNTNLINLILMSKPINPNPTHF